MYILSIPSFSNSLDDAIKPEVQPMYNMALIALCSCDRA